MQNKKIFSDPARDCWDNPIYPIHGLRTPREEIALPERPKIHSHSQIFKYGRSIFCLPHRPNFSDIFDLCLHWVPVVCDPIYPLGKALGRRIGHFWEQITKWHFHSAPKEDIWLKKFQIPFRLQGLKSVILAIFQRGPEWPCPVTGALKNPSLDLKSSFWFSFLWTPSNSGRGN